MGTDEDTKVLVIKRRETGAWGCRFRCDHGELRMQAGLGMSTGGAGCNFLPELSNH